MPRTTHALLIPIIFVIFAIGCGSGGGAAKSATPTEAPTPSDSAAIRAIDFGQIPTFQTLLRQLGGEFDPRAVIYADLTGDGRDEAVVPVGSGGTLGNVAYQVYSLRLGTPAVVLTVTRDQTSVGGLSMAVVDGKLVRTTGKYGPDDPRCCPSSLVKTYYRWDGANLQVEREEEVKGTPGPKAKD